MDEEIGPSSTVMELRALQLAGNPKSSNQPPLYPQVSRPSSIPRSPIEIGKSEIGKSEIGNSEIGKRIDTKSKYADKNETDPFESEFAGLWTPRKEDIDMAAEAERSMRRSRRPFTHFALSRRGWRIADENLMDVSVVARPSGKFIVRAVYNCNTIGVDSVRQALQRRGIEFEAGDKTSITTDGFRAGQTEIFVYLLGCQLRRLYPNVVDKILAWTAVSSVVLMAASAAFDLPTTKAGLVGLASSLSVLVLRSA
jgi:hypothetical protein